MTQKEIDQCFKLFDITGKGFFTFTDFTRVSKLVQGFEIDQVMHEGDKRKLKTGGKRCRGFVERQKTDYDWQKTFKEKAQIMADAANNIPQPHSRGSRRGEGVSMKRLSIA